MKKQSAISNVLAAVIIVVLVIASVVGTYFLIPAPPPVARTVTRTVTAPGAERTVTQTRTVTSEVVRPPTAEEHREQLIEAAKQEGALLVYTSMSPATAAEEVMKTFNEKFPGIDGKIVRFDGGTLYERFRSEWEAGLPTADVVYSTENWMWRKFFDGMIDFYLSPEQEFYPAEFVMPGYFTEMRLIIPGIMVNTNLVPEELYPENLRDVVELSKRPEYNGKIALWDWRTVGTQSVQLYFWYKWYGDELWDMLRTLKDNGAVIEGGVPLMEKTSLGEYAIAYSIFTHWQARYEAEGRPTKLIFQGEGIVVVSTPTALMKKAAHPNAGKLFIDWLISTEGQELILELNKLYSPRPGVPAPTGLPPFEEILDEVAKVKDYSDWFAITPGLMDQADEVFERG